MNPVLAEAQAYIRRAWRVIPLHSVTQGRCSCRRPDCSSPGKHPTTPKGLHSASTDLAVVNAWWDRWPWANVGIVTGQISGLVVLDVDPRHDGDDSLYRLEQRHGTLPETVEVVTGSGGRHLYFQHPGEPVRNSAGRLGTGLDLRGDGGYVVAPPSSHISGRFHQWEASSRPGQVPLADMPAWLTEIHQSPITETHPTTGEIVAVAGGRNIWLTSFAGSIRRRGLSEPVIHAALVAANTHHCCPPLDAREVAVIAKSVARYTPAEM